MTDCQPAARQLVSRSALLLGLALIAIPASAWPGERDLDQPRRRRVVRVRPMPPVLAPVLIRDYLPRNNNVPMYNEPPRLRPAW
jgi:hypothetical protein